MKLKANVIEKVHPLARERAAEVYSPNMDPGRVLTILGDLLTAGVPFEDCGALLLVYHRFPGRPLGTTLQAARKQLENPYIRESKRLLVPSKDGVSVEGRLALYAAEAKLLAICESLGAPQETASEELVAAVRNFVETARRPLTEDESLHIGEE